MMSMMVMGRLLCASAVAAVASSATTHAIRRVRRETMRGSGGGGGLAYFAAAHQPLAMAQAADFAGPVRAIDAFVVKLRREGGSMSQLSVSCWRRWFSSATSAVCVSLFGMAG